MKNLSIWVWMPEDYNPQGKQLSFMQIRQQVQFFGFEPKSLGMTSPLGWLALTISDWAREEQRDGNNDEALESYEDLDSETEKRGYFYIEYLPDDNFHEFHAMLIETATEKGLIVLSDFSEAVFYPDGTSEPQMAFQAIRESREEEMLAQSNAMNSSLAELLSGAKEVRTKESATTLAHVTLKDYLDNKGVKYKLKKSIAEIEWFDYKITVGIHTTYYSGMGIVMERGFTYIEPNKSYEKDFLIYEYIEKTPIKKYIKKSVPLRYEWKGLDSIVENSNFMKLELQNGKFIKTFKLSSNQALYDYIYYHLDMLFDFLNGNQSFYDLVNEMYENESSPIHQNYFCRFRLEDPLFTAINKSMGIRDVIELLYTVNHSKTWEFFNKIQGEFKDCIAQQTSADQERWANFIQDTTEELNHGLKPNTHSQ